MWDTARQIVLSQHPWSAFVYLIVGVIAGALAGTQYSLRAHRPRLFITGSGSGGTQDDQHWTLSILNRPSFAGQNLDGESARELRATLQPAGRTQHVYPLFWDGPDRESQITLEPGQSRHLVPFFWQRGIAGFTVIDQADDPVARFQERDSFFILQLYDRLGRGTKFKLRIQFDDTHLKNTPQLQIRSPLTFATRFAIARSGWQRIRSAFRLR